MQLASRLGQQQDMSIFSYLQELFKIKQEEILFFLMIYIKKNKFSQEESRQYCWISSA